MKMRNKGKVYPSPSSSSSSSTSSNTANRDAVLNLLPAAILALVSILSVDDREVFAYMITRSLKSANSSASDDEKKRNFKKSNTHKPPVFDCECFDCYTSYWFRWDSSPNRELIHQAIEAYEENLACEEQSKKNGKGKKKEKLGRRTNISAPEVEMDLPEVEDGFVVLVPEKAVGVEVNGEAAVVEEAGIDFPEEEPPQAKMVLRSLSANDHKGLARKVLPDVVGLLNSRLWSLWSPNVY